MANPEGTIGKETIRRQTDAFLSGLTTSQYSELRGQDTKQVLEALGLTPTASALLANGGRPNPYLTGAMSASLPMQFSISADKAPQDPAAQDKATQKAALVFTMLINPANMNHGKTSAVYPSYTRNGYVTQMWGPNQDMITATGSSAAFMTDGEGLTAVARRRSFGFLNFMALVGAYRNNGYEFLDPSALRGPLTRVINRVHGVEMFYDGQLFMGHFNNFTIDENAEKPFVFNYNFEFVCSSLSTNYNEIRGHFDPQVGGLATSIQQAGSGPLVGGIDYEYLSAKQRA